MIRELHPHSHWGASILPSPVLLVVSQVTDIRDGLAADLDGRFGSDYVVLASKSGPDAVQTMAALAENGQPIAVVTAERAAAVYAASAGLETLVLERVIPGGQAGTSSLTEIVWAFTVA